MLSFGGGCAEMLSVWGGCAEMLSVGGGCAEMLSFGGGCAEILSVGGTLWPFDQPWALKSDHGKTTPLQHGVTPHHASPNKYIAEKNVLIRKMRNSYTNKITHVQMGK